MAFSKVLAGKAVGGPVSARLTVDGRDYINFYGSGYLALSRVPEIRGAVARALAQDIPFARQLPPSHGGADPTFDAVERAAAQACGTEASVYFASGYLIGMVGLASLERPCDLIVIDELAHYCLNDAAKLTGKPVFTFAHCDLESLRALLKQRVPATHRPLLITDGAFATTGRIAPLADYAAILAEYDGWMFVDESHAFGVVGEHGRGAAEHCGVEHLASIGTTLNKAYCAQGAVVACTGAAATRVRTVPPLGASSAGSPLSATAAAASLAYVADRPGLRKTLRDTADYLRIRLRNIGLDPSESPAPIVTFKSGTFADMHALQRRAFERGIYLHHSTYIGAGPEGVIRCAIFRDHSRQDMDELIDALG